MSTKEQFIEWLKSVNARFEDTNRDVDTVFVYSKDEYNEQKKHPRKEIYVPYIRVSWHDDRDDALYTRWNGYCSYMTEDKVKSIIVNGI